VQLAEGELSAVVRPRDGIETAPGDWI
jgi:hypothetical protein